MKKLLLFLIFTPILLQAHGVKYKIIKNKGVGLVVQYHTGEPIVDAEVSIYSPKNYKKPYMRMTTDEQGSFMFLPNALGKWAVVITDNSGHGIQKNITVDEDWKTPPLISDFAQKIIMIFCIIWGLLGTILFYLSTRKNIVSKEV